MNDTLRKLFDTVRQYTPWPVTHEEKKARSAKQRRADTEIMREFLQKNGIAPDDIARVFSEHLGIGKSRCVMQTIFPKENQQGYRQLVSPVGKDESNILKAVARTTNALGFVSLEISDTSFVEGFNPSHYKVIDEQDGDCMQRPIVHLRAWTGFDVKVIGRVAQVKSAMNRARETGLPSCGIESVLEEQTLSK